MPAVTTYVVQPYEPTRKGLIAILAPVEAHSADHARRLVERLGAKHGGAVAFSRRSDQEDWSDPVILQVVGQVPREVRDLIRTAA